jgi:hypothetical protein
VAAAVYQVTRGEQPQPPNYGPVSGQIIPWPVQAGVGFLNRKRSEAGGILYNGTPKTTLFRMTTFHCAGGPVNTRRGVVVTHHYQLGSAMYTTLETQSTPAPLQHQGYLLGGVCKGLWNV